MEENKERNRYAKYLPLGTVVLLKNAEKKLMITGFCTMQEEKPGVMYDYNGCLYPEGYLKSNQTLLFNHDQIAKIYHMGYESDEQKAFTERLKKAVNERNNEKK